MKPQPGGAFDRKTINIVGNLTLKIFLKSQMLRGLPGVGKLASLDLTDSLIPALYNLVNILRP